MEVLHEIPENIAARLDIDSADAGFLVLDDVLENRSVKPVYQPIVSLTDGRVFGYEALSRILGERIDVNISDIFTLAERINKTWELEKLCRDKALESSVSMDKGKKLFLNVDPNIMHDANFREGFTKERLKKYGLSAGNIVFEITERVAVTDHETFLASVNHYKCQAYGIAIDDAGSGFSGLNIIVDTKPNFIKLDINLVRNIDKDEIKRSLCKAMVGFGKSAGIKLIAEGIETEAELKTLIKLNVDLGQGFYLGTPKEAFEGISAQKAEFIARCRERRRRSGRRPIRGRRNREEVPLRGDVRIGAEPINCAVR